ncbi:MAG: hypothetical protein EOP83_30945 [Verrucomicrobiaceae bacterium]|nr:MAG: hypothetical protein EOP83_30945 [Verrucomicrobiaceae bacterium]
MGAFEKRPPDMDHKTFMRFEIRKRWPEVHRVRLGNPRLPHRTSIPDWCSENTSAWYRSDGCEVYFFPDKDMAFHFKVKWAGNESGETSQLA